jgi:hypothetical protein
MVVSGLSRLATVAGVAAAASCAASVAHAASIYEFAEFSQLSSAPANVFWDNPGNTTSAVFSTGAAGKSIAVPIQFSFVNNPALSSVTDVSATLLISNAGVAGVAATKTPILDQKGIFGDFQILYSGLSDLVISGIHYSTGTNLLSGTFTNGQLSGQGPKGNIIAATNASSVTFTSAIPGALINSTKRDVTFSLSAVTPNLGAIKDKALKSFSANANGQFDQGVPEPATWTMLILGMAALGAAARRRRAQA